MDGENGERTRNKGVGILRADLRKLVLQQHDTKPTTLVRVILYAYYFFSYFLTRT